MGEWPEYVTVDDLEDMAEDNYRMRKMIVDSTDYITRLIVSLFCVNLLVLGGITWFIIYMLKG